MGRVKANEELTNIMKKTRNLAAFFLLVLLAKAPMPTKAAMESFTENYGSAYPSIS
jgi:hypothetical protein